MGWNLKTHILGHAKSVANNLSIKFNENDPKNQHFTFSIDVSQLIIQKKCKSQNQIDEIMTSFMKDLANHEHIFEESKGRSKSGKQLRRKIVFNFIDALIAYHNSSSDSINSNNYSVEPHLHILFDKKKKLGICYYQIKKAINVVSIKYGLVFNFQEKVKEYDTSLRVKASNFSWFLKRSNDKDFLSKIENGDKLVLQIDMFVQHYKNTGNLQYYIKGMKDFQGRLKSLNIDFLYDGKNLKIEFPLYLSNEQKLTLKILYQGNKENIYNILNSRSNKIARAYLEYQFGFSSVVIEELIERGFYPFKFEIDSNRINYEIIRKNNSKNISYKKTINYCYKSDISQVLLIAKNKKEIQELMKRLGYINFTYKQKIICSKRIIVGFTFSNNNNKTIMVYYSSLKISACEIRAKLIENKKILKQSKLDNLKSFLNEYISPLKKSKSKVEFEKIYHFEISYNLTNWYIKEVEKDVDFKNDNTHIIDIENEVLTRQANDNLNEIENIDDFDKIKVLENQKVNPIFKFRYNI